MSNNPFHVQEIPTSEIRFFVKRSRDKKGFEEMKESIRLNGLKIPIKVRPIKGDPKYKFELIAGQGRLTAFRELRIPTIPAIVERIADHEAVSQFLVENLQRKPLPWLQKARLMKRAIDAEMSVRDIATAYSVGEDHVRKCIRILRTASPNLKDDVLSRLTVDEAVTLVTLPPKGQDIVIETIGEEQRTADDIHKLVERAKNLEAENQPLTKQALKDSIKRTEEDLRRLRDSLKVVRLHAGLGPDNLRALLSDRKFKAALDKRGINYSKFAAL